MTAQGIVYGVEPNLSAEEFRRVLVASGLDARRPAEDLDRLDRMLRGANLIVTARAYTPERALLGVARTISDFSYCAYVSDLAVAKPQQGNGIGQGLLDAVRKQLGPEVTVILLSAPGVETYYQKIGMRSAPNAFVTDRER
jgi:GNAT superfamily N-acetyltransferase